MVALERAKACPMGGRNPHNAAHASQGMVSWLPHAIIPGLVALAFFAVPRRTALLWLPLVWLADLDYVIQSQHRAITHSAFIPLGLFAAVPWLWRARDPTARFWEFATRPGAPVALTLSAYYLASHLLLDVFQGGVVLFWPVLDTNFFLDFEILLDTGQNTFQPQGEGGTSQGAPELSPVYTWFTYEHSAIAVFLGSCAAVAAGVWMWRRWRGTTPKRPVIVERKATLVRPIQKP